MIFMAFQKYVVLDAFGPAWKYPVFEERGQYQAAVTVDVRHKKASYQRSS